MPRHFSRLLVCALAGFATALGAADFKLNGHTFTLPAGLELELVAGTNLVERPVSASFDEQGRLYVTDSSGSNDKIDKQITNPTHRIVRLEDTDGDGRFDKSVVFADKMMFPEGCLWYDGSLYVAAVPSIWKLTDTNNDGVADVREEWFQGKTATGCANDLHGPYLGPDGWIYWCKGAFAEQEIPHHNQPATKDKASHIFRARPEGSMRESFLYGGMDNPVEVAWTDDGELFFTCTFIQHPAGGKRDALVHGIYGGVYGKDHDVLDPLPRTGPLLEPMTHLGPAAPSGLCAYKARIFGDAYHDNLFVTQFNLRKVSCHTLHPMGATFRTTDTDFMVSDHPDFHPTDVLEDADGSLLVVDTGGWYKLCCPTSQMAKPDVLGAIYRIRRKGAKKMEDPRGLAIKWDSLKSEAAVELLRDSRPAVQERAIASLARQGQAVIPALTNALVKWATPERKKIVWALTRMEGEAARDAVRLAFQDPLPEVVTVAVQSAGLHRDQKALPALRSIVQTGSLPTIGWAFRESRSFLRPAVAGLGRVGGASEVGPLVAGGGSMWSLPGDKAQAQAMQAAGWLDSTGALIDPAFRHACLFALIEIGDADALRKRLVEKNNEGPRMFLPYEDESLLIPLFQIDRTALRLNNVIPLLRSQSAHSRKTALMLIGNHPEWAPEAAVFLRGQLTPYAFHPELPEECTWVEELLGRMGREPVVQEAVAEVLREPGTKPATRMLILQSMARNGFKNVSPAWAGEMRRSLETISKDTASTNDVLLRQVIMAVRALPPVKTNLFAEPLLAIARDTKRATELRLEALAAISGEINPLDEALVTLLRTKLAADQSPLERGMAASVLSRAKLSDDQLFALCDSVKTAGPMEVPKLLEAYGALPNEAVGLKLIGSLKESRGVKGVRPDVLRARLAKAPASVKAAGEELILMLNADAPKQKARLEELAGNLGKGDIRRGQLLFHSTKAACMSCHQIGYVGGKVGPDLSRVGGTRTERDLLEAIVFPSASFVRSYEPVMVATKGGEEFSGVLRGDNAEGVTLITGLGAEQRIARADITDMRPGTVSVMPEGLDQVLTGQELADLVAFLKSMK